jgi:site-specific recombinase
MPRPNNGDLEDIIQDRAQTDGHYAIAHGLLRVAHELEVWLARGVEELSYLAANEGVSNEIRHVANNVLDLDASFDQVSREIRRVGDILEEESERRR